MNRHTELLQSQLKTFLKDKIYGLAPQFTRKDKRKSGRISFDEFVAIMHNMDIPYTLSSEKNWKLLYNEMADEKGLAYPSFLESIEKFVPPVFEKKFENEEKKTPLSTVREVEEVQMYDPLKNLNILNRQKVPVNQLDNFFLRARKIRLFLRDISDSEQVLQDQLRKRSKNDVISLDELKDFVVDKLLEKKTIKITKKELEGFLSSYIYNRDGVTPVEEVAKNIFMEDTKASFELHQIKRSVPPVREPGELLQESCPRIKQLLEKIEEKFYNQGSHAAIKIFKKFDTDRDGYVTEEDLQTALTIHQIVHDSKDVKDLMGFLDSDKKGYVTFAQFNKKIQPNIVNVNKSRLQEAPENHMENHQPSLEFLSTQQKKLGHYSKMQEEFISEFRPNDKIIKFQKSTRYGSNPSHQNTFVHYHMPPDSSMGEEHLPPKKIIPFNLGAEEKAKRLQVEENKVQNLKRTRNERAWHLVGLEENAVQKDQQKIYHRALSKDEYEKRCRFTSPFANMPIE